MKKILLLIFLLPFFAHSQSWVNGTIQRLSTTGEIRYIQGSALDSLVRLQKNSLANLDMLRYNSATGKFIPQTPAQVLTNIGAQGSISFTTPNTVANANGITMTSNVIRLNKVSATSPGILTTGVDTIAGGKIFTSNVTVTGIGSADYVVNRGVSTGTGRTRYQTAGVDNWNTGMRANTTNYTLYNENLGAAVYTVNYATNAITFTPTVTIPTPFILGSTSVASTGTQLNYLGSATGTTGTTSTNLVFSTSPTLVTPILGTPQSGVITNLTGTCTSCNVGGSAATLTTSRNIQGVAFNGSANIDIINGTGFVKATGTTLSYDNSTYLTTSSAASTYLPLAAGSGNPLTGTLYTNAEAAIGAASAGTGRRYGLWGNTSGSILWGIESSAGGSLFTGAPAYAAVIGSNSGGGSTVIGSNGVTAITINTSQNTTLVGTLGINGTADNVKGGTYTPTLTNGTNISSSTARLCHYTRIGNEVTVTGRLDFTPTTSTGSVISVSLPVASNLATIYDLEGLTRMLPVDGSSDRIEGDFTNDRAIINFNSTGIAGWIFFTFTYTVI